MFFIKYKIKNTNTKNIHTLLNHMLVLVLVLVLALVLVKIFVVMFLFCEAEDKGQLINALISLGICSTPKELK